MYTYIYTINIYRIGEGLLFRADSGVERHTRRMPLDKLSQMHMHREALVGALQLAELAHEVSDLRNCVGRMPFFVAFRNIHRQFTEKRALQQVGSRDKVKRLTGHTHTHTHTHTHRQRTTPPPPKHTHTTRTTPQTPQTNTSHKHLTT